MKSRNLDKGKKYYVDFHTHSSRSDGAGSRQELIEKAILESEDATMILAVTDHNILFEDLDELQTKFGNKIILLPGTEISTSYVVPRTGEQLEVHMIALDYDIRNEMLAEMLRKNQHDKRAYIEAILTKLENAGYPVASYEELVELAPSTHIGRMVIARVMSAKYNLTIDECFDRFFGSYGERTCYVPNEFKYVPLKEAISICKKAGGIPILCHPYFYKLQENDMLNMIAQFKSAGGLAMETLYGKYSAEQVCKLKSICKKLGLKESAGSDNHLNPGEHFGKYPVYIYEELMSLKRGR